MLCDTVSLPVQRIFQISCNDDDGGVVEQCHALAFQRWRMEMGLWIGVDGQSKKQRTLVVLVTLVYWWYRWYWCIGVLVTLVYLWYRLVLVYWCTGGTGVLLY